jgi:hypothetical protein
MRQSQEIQEMKNEKPVTGNEPSVTGYLLPVTGFSFFISFEMRSSISRWHINNAIRAKSRRHQGNSH